MCVETGGLCCGWSDNWRKKASEGRPVQVADGLDGWKGWRWRLLRGLVASDKISGIGFARRCSPCRARPQAWSVATATRLSVKWQGGAVQLLVTVPTWVGMIRSSQVFQIRLSVNPDLFGGCYQMWGNFYRGQPAVNR
ncbi:hypothetical protein LX36DRAFT_386166 [Colletotrichum falcatum]|nr:hypothetical protein LX36DRAFT_386166 [Colletotrichum falcatum]